jgi:hypothetical protein
LAFAAASGLATTTSLLVVTSTYQPLRPLAPDFAESSLALAASSDCSLCLTITGTAPAALTDFAAAALVTATFSVVPSAASQEPPKSEPVSADNLAETPLAHLARLSRAVAWSALTPRSRCIAARRCGDTSPLPLGALAACGVVPAIDGRVKATAAPAAATTAAATAIFRRCATVLRWRRAMAVRLRCIVEYSHRRGCRGGGTGDWRYGLRPKRVQTSTTVGTIIGRRR